jgi:DNA sulfur modification protein DndB
LNRTVQKTSRSLDILYDHSDPLNGLVLAVAAQVPIFQKRVEKNSQSLALRSPKFVTLSSLYDACQQLLGGASAVAELKDDNAATHALEFCVKYWNHITQKILPWSQVLTGEIKPSDARTEYVVAHSVAFYALGVAGAEILRITGPGDWRKNHEFALMDGLEKIDWAKTNPEWQGISMLGHSIVTRRQTRVATGRFICHKLAPERFAEPPPVLETE